MNIVLKPEEIDSAVQNYTEMLKRKELSNDEIDRRIKSYLQNRVVIKYTKKWQDEKLNDLIELILNVPGGYFQFQELCNQPHIEFEHYKEKNRRSYEKGNVTLSMAKKELTPDSYDIFERFKNSNTAINYEVNLDINENIYK